MNDVRALDHYVDYLPEETIIERAAVARREYGIHPTRYIDVAAVLSTLLGKRIGSKGTLNVRWLDLPDDAPLGALASVAYDPLVLSIDRSLYEDARLGDPQARFIIAHEIAHIFEHDHTAKAFSPSHSQSIAKEKSAEWQANTWAREFLCPSSIDLLYRHAREIADHYGLPLSDAEDAIRVSKHHYRPILDRTLCIQCGNFSVRHDWTGQKCRDCSAT